MKTSKLLKSNKGNTFIEVCVCLAIFGISLNAALHTVQSFQSVRKNTQERLTTVQIFKKIKQNFLVESPQNLPTEKAAYYVDRDGNATKYSDYIKVEVTPFQLDGIQNMKKYSFNLTVVGSEQSTLNFEVIR